MQAVQEAEVSAKLVKAAEEARAALYGARECLGDIANISHAIELLNDALGETTRNVCKHRRTSRSPATGEEQCLDCLSYIRDGVDPRAELLAHASKRDCPKCLQRGWVFNEDRCSLCGATGESTQDIDEEEPKVPGCHGYDEES